jgi:hypothetical protein
MKYAIEEDVRTSYYIDIPDETMEAMKTEAAQRALDARIQDNPEDIRRDMVEGILHEVLYEYLRTHREDCRDAGRELAKLHCEPVSEEDMEYSGL